MEATFLTAIHINKVRHLKDIDIPLSSDMRKNLILTGKNGSGKTSVLNAICAALDYIKPIVIPPNSSGQFESKPKCEEVSIALSQEETFFIDYLNKHFVMAYFKDRRDLKVDISKNIEKVDLKLYYDFLDHPSRELVKYMVNLKTTQAFAKTQGNEKRADEIEKWFQRFEGILQTVYEDESVKLNFDIESFQFTITMNDREPFDFNTMSTGYAAVFDIIADLTMRMEAMHRYDLEGIVLVDEIDAHLHVELQRKILPILTKLFPNIQFIMTTHSPFVLNSAQNAVIYDLEKHMLVEDGLTNLPYEGIVEGYFGADRMSQELRGKFERYKVLIAKEELTDEKYAETAELETYLDEVPDYLALEFAAEYSRLKLEFANRG